jgi:hypothetical protein
MVIAYTPKSRFFNDLEKARTGEIPWYEVLSKPGQVWKNRSVAIEPISLDRQVKILNDGRRSKKMSL